MPPVKTAESHHTLDTSYPVNKRRTDESLLLPPAFLRHKRKQREARESSSSRSRPADITTGRTKESISRENVELSKEMGEKGSGVSVVGKMVRGPEGEAATSRNGENIEDTIVLSRPVLKTPEAMDEKENTLSLVTATLQTETPTENKETCATNEKDPPNEMNTETSSADSSNLGSGNTESIVAKTQKSRYTGTLTLERARDTKNDAPYVTIAAYVYKPTKKTKTGISINQRTGEMIKISEIDKGGLFDSSGLKVGDEVLRINNIETKGLFVKDVATMIGEMAGSVTILSRRKLSKVKKKKRPLLPNQKVVHSLNDTTEPKAGILQKTSKLVLRPSKMSQESVVAANGSGLSKNPLKSIRRPSDSKQENIVESSIVITNGHEFGSCSERNKPSHKVHLFKAFRRNPARSTIREPEFPSDHALLSEDASQPVGIQPCGVHRVVDLSHAENESVTQESEGQPCLNWNGAVSIQNTTSSTDEAGGIADNALAMLKSEGQPCVHWNEKVSFRCITSSMDEAGGITSASTGTLTTMALSERALAVALHYLFCGAGHEYDSDSSA